jgi:hypothetical protein
VTGPTYKDGRALWAAAASRAKVVAAGRGINPSAVLREFVFDRFLARVFRDSRGPWVLKGGHAALLRVNDARTTKDIDLLRELGDLGAAVADLRALLDVDLGDHFRFVITGVEPSRQGAGQPGVDGLRVGIDAYCGTKKVDSFGVDLVTGSLMTAAPSLERAETLAVPGVHAVRVRLYPVEDHIADKLCATQAPYGSAGDQPSSRVQDLVDLVVFARTQDLEGTGLIAAIRGEWTHRGLDGPPVFDPPSDWKNRYPALARRVPACGDITTFDAAVDLVRQFLRPALDGTADGRRWSPTALSWRAER